MRVLILLLAFVSTAVLAQENPTRSDDELETIPVEDRSGTDSAPPAADDDELDEQVFYSGLGIQRAETDFSNIGEAINLNLVLGFRIPTLKWFGIEIDIAQTIIPGENTSQEQSQAGGGTCLTDNPPFPPGCTPGGGNNQQVAQDLDELVMQALGVSAAFKSTGRFYGMGRYGYRYIATSIDELNEKRSGTGLGFGAGYRWGEGLSGVELLYQELSEDVDSLGLNFYARFGNR